MISIALDLLGLLLPLAPPSIQVDSLSYLDSRLRAQSRWPVTLVTHDSNLDERSLEESPVVYLRVAGSSSRFSMTRALGLESGFLLSLLPAAASGCDSSERHHGAHGQTEKNLLVI